MKSRTDPKRKPARSPELKGVVKEMTGRLTSDPRLEAEGQAEAGTRSKAGGHLPKNPDPHRRG